MTAPHSSYATPPSVLAKITSLPDLSMSDIKALWKSLFGAGTPTHNRLFLERRIAYRLQEIEFRKVDRNTLDRNKRRIQTLLESGTNKRLDRDIRLMPGTVLTREYRGTEHRVMVTADGRYEFEGRIYPSLSRIAKEVTGTAWSGPVFFGLKSSAPVPSAGKRGARE